MDIDRLDHVVLTVRDIEVSCDFYSRVLGMEVVRFGGNRTAVKFGRQKLNLHHAGHELEPKAAAPTPGAGDLCFIATTPLSEVIPHLQRCSALIVEGPVRKTGATGAIESVYVRDPDGNLIEISNYLDEPR